MFIRTRNIEKEDAFATKIEGLCQEMFIVAHDYKGDHIYSNKRSGELLLELERVLADFQQYRKECSF